MNSYDLNPDSIPFAEIGRGSYGVVFRRGDLFEVYKRPHCVFGPWSDMDIFDLWNDLEKHKAIEDCFAALSYNRLHLPRVLGFIPANDHGWWFQMHSKFEPQFQTPSHVLITERVLPIPLSVRDALVDLLCPIEYRAMTKWLQRNRYCLLHPLLGERLSETIMEGGIETEDFELCIDDLEHLNMDIYSLMDIMAETLAIFHFRAWVDGRGIKFVLGGAPTASHSVLPYGTQILQWPVNSQMRPVYQGLNLLGGVVHLWIIDFNQVSAIRPDYNFINMALSAFVEPPKPYFPRPRYGIHAAAHTDYWDFFRTAYLQHSQRLCYPNDMSLALHFIGAVEGYYQQLSYETGWAGGMGGWTYM